MKTLVRYLVYLLECDISDVNGVYIYMNISVTGVRILQYSDYN